MIQLPRRYGYSSNTRNRDCFGDWRCDCVVGQMVGRDMRRSTDENERRRGCDATRMGSGIGVVIKSTWDEVKMPCKCDVCRAEPGRHISPPNVMIESTLES